MNSEVILNELRKIEIKFNSIIFFLNVNKRKVGAIFKPRSDGHVFLLF